MKTNWSALERAWQNSLRRRASKFDPVYSVEDILQAAHDGNPRALDMIEFNKQWPSRRHFHHQVHMDFGLECDNVCKPHFNGEGGNMLIQRIKAAYTVEEIAEGHTNLSGYDPITGPCFLHGGSGSEFVIWPEDQHWKCFGQCGIGGDVIDLVRAMEERQIEWQ